MKWLACLLCLVPLSLIAADARAVSIDLVTVGNPGNAPDTRYNGISVGSVGYAYQIGKYEVTARQYTEFLNAVAKADPNGLYNTSMGTYLDPSFGAKIIRTGSSPNYSYSVGADRANRPVNHVTFWDAARFANWLHNGQPIGAQGPGTTEGGAYHDVGDQDLFGRNAGAKFFIPTEDEWYKAAYHDKTAGLGASYFDYPTGTNAAPGNDITETTNVGNNANYHDGDYAIYSPYWRTVAGEFEVSDSPYGTFDQAGNVLEWNETKVTSSTRGLRGGSFFSPYYVHASSYTNAVPNYENTYDPTPGFRVASIAVPEPSTLLLLCIGSLAVLWRRLRLVRALILVAAVGFSCGERAGADTFGSGANTFNIEFVSIGNPEGVSPNGYFVPVPYSFRVGKFEISRDIVTKANSAGDLGVSLADLTAFGGNGLNRPASGVSWNEAARFVNWLNTSQGFTPAYKFTTQPGDDGYGANQNIDLWVLGDPGFTAANPFRNTLAHYFLPSADEWCKAAYFDPSSGAYYDYPTGSNNGPTPVTSGTAANTAVYLQPYPYESGPADVISAGGLSPYGTMGQGGNVYEWQETGADQFGAIHSPSATRPVGGGSWQLNPFHLTYWDKYNYQYDPTFESDAYGFRVASIPEPSTLLLATLAAAVLLWRRRGLFRIAIVVAAVGIVTSAHAVSIPTVPVGNPGNAGDLATGNLYGVVAYAYCIGTTELTNAQYVAFLNEKAKSDPLALYNTLMGSEARGGITRTDVSGAFIYATRANLADKPVNYVSWYDSIR